ncbi:MAG: acyltransferase, partial [Pseudohongiellaceae bacterium]
MHYRREVDGLRAVAVIPVIFFHAGFELFQGGYVGVDVFFVISGYLITALILKEKEEGRFSLLEFYERRVRRIIPALFLVMMCCIPFAVLWMAPEQLKAFSQSVLAMSLFASNILFWRESGYFDTAAEEKPLLHTWSLAVEEQYYLFFPLFIMLFWFLGRGGLARLTAAVAFISLLLAEYGWRYEPDANFYLLPTRAWELFVGALCAFYSFGKAPRNSEPLALLGLAGILLAIFFYSEATPFPSVYALAPVLGAALIILYGGQATVVGRLLSTPLPVAIGLISYSAYLWHQPLFAFARIRSPGDPGVSLMLALSGASLLLATLSWRYVEIPFRRRIPGQSPGQS